MLNAVSVCVLLIKSSRVQNALNLKTLYGSKAKCQFPSFVLIGCVLRRTDNHKGEPVTY